MKTKGPMTVQTCVLTWGPVFVFIYAHCPAKHKYESMYVVDRITNRLRGWALSHVMWPCPLNTSHNWNSHGPDSCIFYTVWANVVGGCFYQDYKYLLQVPQTRALACVSPECSKSSVTMYIHTSTTGLPALIQCYAIWDSCKMQSIFTLFSS